MEGASGDGTGDSSQLDNSYLQGQYVVEGTDDDAVASGDNEEEHKDKSPLREQDRFLPIANVARIMKKSIPKTGKIAKDAKECVQECVSEFISFITSEEYNITEFHMIIKRASERCHQEKRKTINGEDILFAMSTLGFDSYVEPLKLYLQKYREAMKGDKGASNRHEEMDEMGDETYLTQGLTANILTAEQGAQQSVIYTNYTNQGYTM